VLDCKIIYMLLIIEN